VLAAIVVAITLLYAANVTQVQKLQQGSKSTDGFADKVEYKQVKTMSPTDAPGNQEIIPQTPDGTNPPSTAPPPILPSPTPAPVDEKMQKNNDEKDLRFPPFVSVMKNGDAEYYTYTPRGQPRDDQEKQQLIQQWGSWNVQVPRPLLTQDFYQNYPNRDVPRDKFPKNAWQTDQNYLSKFLPEAVALVQRAQDAILAEYGQPATGTWAERTKMFALTLHPEDFANVTLSDTKGKAIFNDQGGWTTPQSWEALKRRILHAVMTEDSFVFAMGGHSSAAGHGNHFQQSYTLQIQWILEAVFARLGVRHQARNFGNGGLGTVHNGLGAGSIYGPDVDVLMWDSSMTEGIESFKDIMHRQHFLSGLKIPVLWTEAVEAAKFFHTTMGIPVGSPGSGKNGIIAEQSNITMVEKEIPFALRYMSCASEIKSVCKNHEYDAKCWVDRPDIKSPENQRDYPEGRAGWHPGMRAHQLKGRVLAFTFLEALRQALSLWKDAKDYKLADDQWHMTAQYEEMRKKVEEHIEEGACYSKMKSHGIEDVCRLPLKSRTEFTPRAFPSLSNIRTLMPPEMLQHVNPSDKSLYDGPDVFNPALHPQKDAVDVLSIVEAGPGFHPVLVPGYAFEYYKKPKFEDPPKVPVGKGVFLSTYADDHYCDGTVDSWCNRGKDSTCLLSGHNDGRHGLRFDGYSGWVVMNLPDVRYGFIMVKIESWHLKDSVPKTNGWTSINNEGEKVQRRLGSPRPTDVTQNLDLSGPQSTRALKRKEKPQPYCNEFQFEYAIDGAITTYNVTTFNEVEQKGHLDRVVETFLLLNDRDFTGGKEKEVETAIRMTGCGRIKTFSLTHMYWA
jgi:hypothetical protein